jgi:prophage tail gpP-like protein
MILKIGNRKLDTYNDVSVGLQYDSVASVFSFSFYFDPANADHRAMFKPGNYADVTIEHEGELLITGTLLSPVFQSGPEQQLMTISGYSKTGVLEDCEIPTSAYPLQSDNLTLEQIANRCIGPFGLNLIVDPVVSDKVNSKYKKSTAGDQQSVKEYLSSLAGQKHVILSHDNKGNLLMTEANVNAAPVFDFSGGQPALNMELQFDGQRMHSNVTLIKQQTKGRKDGSNKKGNAGQAENTNPYVPVFRPRVNRQTSGEEVDTVLAARNMLSEELKGIALKIDIHGWTLGGKIIRPNTIITVQDEYLYLFEKTRWLVAAVEFKGDSESKTATLTCFLPDVFSSAAPKNIFG